MLMERIGLIWVEFQLANKDEGRAKRTQKGTSEDKEHGYCHVHVQEGEMAG